MFIRAYDENIMMTAFQVQTIKECKDNFGTEFFFIEGNVGQNIRFFSDGRIEGLDKKWEYFMFDKESYMDDNESFKAFEKAVRFL